MSPMSKKPKPEPLFNDKYKKVIADETLNALRATEKAADILREIAVVLKDLPAAPRGARDHEWLSGARVEEALRMLKPHSKALTEATEHMRLLTADFDFRKVISAAERTSKDQGPLHWTIKSIVATMESTACIVEKSKMPPHVASAKELRALSARLRKEVSVPLEESRDRWYFIWASLSGQAVGMG